MFYGIFSVKNSSLFYIEIKTLQKKKLQKLEVLEEVLFGALVFLTSVVILMRRGRWSDPREVSTDQAHVGRRSADAIERSGAVLLVPVTLVGWFSFKIPRLVSPIQSAIILPLASSVSSVYHKWWWPLVSPSMRRDSPSPSVRLLTGGVYPWSQLLAGGMYTFLMDNGLSLLFNLIVSSSR